MIMAYHLSKAYGSIVLPLSARITNVIPKAGLLLITLSSEGPQEEFLLNIGFNTFSINNAKAPFPKILAHVIMGSNKI